MLPVIPAPREQLSKYAPKMLSMVIPVDKIKDVIGKGGKVIQEICANCNCKIDVEEDGHVFVSAIDVDDANRAIHTIKTIVEDPEVGAIYKGRVTRLMNFGAFVEIAPGKEGLVHISKLDTKRVERVEDVVAVGDELIVMVTEIDQQGRINLSRRDAILALEAKRAEQQAQQYEGQTALFHGATGSPGSFILPAHSRHISISSQMRKQESQTSLRQMGHWLNRSLASCPAVSRARCRSRW